MKQKRGQHSGMTDSANETNGLNDVVLVACGVTPCAREAILGVAPHDTRTTNQWWLSTSTATIRRGDPYL